MMSVSWASRIKGSLVAGVVFCAVLGAGREARARSTGVGSQFFLNLPIPSCNACHNDPAATVMTPTVTLDATLPPTPTSQIQLTVTVTTVNGGTAGGAGFNLRSSQQGVFAIGGTSSTGIQILPPAVASPTLVTTNNWSEATHTMAKTGVLGVATFTVLWTPSAGTMGTVTFTAWGNAVNQNGNNQGDRASTATRDVVFCTLMPFYRDSDGDTYGTPSITVNACTAPTGYVANNTDCNDGNLAVHPNAGEMCNGIDDNCNGAIDEGIDPLNFYPDTDGDLYGSASAAPKAACSLAVAGAGYVTDHSDCDDTNANIHPGAPEICNNLKDDNCNLIIDTDAPATSTFYRDADGDGFGSAALSMAGCAPPAGYVSSSTDCNDADATIHPGATEVCNGKDDNCDGTADNGLGNLSCGVDPCLTTVAACVGGVPQVCTPVCPDAGTGVGGSSGGVGGAGGAGTGGTGAGGTGAGGTGVGGTGAGGGAGNAGLGGRGGGAGGNSGRGGGAGANVSTDAGATDAPTGGGGRSGTSDAGTSGTAGPDASQAGSDASVAQDGAADATATDAGKDAGTLPATLPKKSDGGCGCRTAGQRPENDLLCLLAAFGLALLTRRRRR